MTGQPRRGGSLVDRLAACAFILGAAVATARSEPCPLESLAGQITRISGSSNDVSLMRAGRQVAVDAMTCILFRDRLDASRVAEVEVLTAEGLKVFGRDGQNTIWVAPESTTPRSDAWLLLNQFFGGLFRSPPPVGGVGRGAGCRAISELGETPRPQSMPPLQPIAALQRVPMQIEANLPTLIVAWKSGSGGDEQHVQLLRQDGTLLLERRVCGPSSAALPIAPAALAPGDRLLLRIRAKSGASLDYTIDVVAPGALGDGTGWPHGARLLASDDHDVKLDALGWIATGSGTSFAAARILSAALREEKF